MTNSLFLFHLNLAFSSIEESSRKQVVEKCYFPLLDFIEDNKIKASIEATGYTLLAIKKERPDFLDRLNILIKSKLVEFIGSGFVQLISPLVPYEVNKKNIEIGLEIYSELLDIKPKFMLVNEMAFSRSLVDIFVEFSFQGIIVEKNNVEYALSFGGNDFCGLNGCMLLEGANNTSIEVIWIDSVNFQKFQMVSHGIIDYTEYSKFIGSAIKRNKLEPFVIYASDAEVFNYRPGRFNDEASIIEDEWEIIRYTTTNLIDEYGLIFILPSEYSELNKHENKLSLQATNIIFPVVVKKQFYYNLSRWAVTGRADSWLNAVCFRIYKELHGKTSHIDDWEDLCYIWSSDFRTHITEKRWSKLLKHIKTRYGISYKNPVVSNNDVISDVEVNEFNRKKWKYASESLLVDLDVLQGLTIENITFKNQSWKGFITSFHLGEFESIDFAHQYLSNNFFIYAPKYRVGNLDKVGLTNIECFKNSEFEGISCHVSREKIGIKLSVFVSYKDDSVFLTCDFLHHIVGDHIVRLFKLYFDSLQVNGKLKLATHNGGKFLEHFHLNVGADHTKAASLSVSCSGGLGATEGVIYLYDDYNALKMSWDATTTPLFPMVTVKAAGKQKFIELQFSVSEIDETSVEHLLPLDKAQLKIESVSLEQIE